MADTKRRTAAEYRQRRNQIPSGAPQTRLTTPARVALYGFLGIVSVLVLIILAQHIIGVLGERAAAEVRATDASAEARAELFEDIRREVDFESLSVGTVDLRSPEGLAILHDNPEIRTVIENLEIVGPGELFLYRKRVGTSLVYRLNGRGFEEIDGVLEFLSEADYPPEELTAAAQDMVEDDRLVWFEIDPTPEPLAEEDESPADDVTETEGEEDAE